MAIRSTTLGVQKGVLDNVRGRCEDFLSMLDQPFHHVYIQDTIGDEAKPP